MFILLYRSPFGCTPCPRKEKHEDTEADFPPPRPAFEYSFLWSAGRRPFWCLALREDPHFRSSSAYLTFFPGLFGFHPALWLFFLGCLPALSYDTLLLSSFLSWNQLPVSHFTLQNARLRYSSLDCLSKSMLIFVKLHCALNLLGTSQFWKCLPVELAWSWFWYRYVAASSFFAVFGQCTLSDAELAYILKYVTSRGVSLLPSTCSSDHLLVELVSLFLFCLALCLRQKRQHAKHA